MLNFEPTSEEQEFIASFRKFCEQELAPHVETADEAGAIPREHYRKLGQIGYNGLMHASQFGGQSASYTLATLAQVELAAVCGSTFFSVGASAGLFGGPIAAHGTPEQRARYLPDIISGETIGCLAVTEPQAGSDVSGLTTTATLNSEGTEYTISGSKTYITNAPNCDFALVLARARNEEGKDLGLTHFIVPAGAKGFAKGQPMKKMGLRGSPTGELFFEDVVVPAENVLGGAQNTGKGFRITMEAFNKERLAMGAYCVGVMASCLADSRRFSKERRAFGRPIAKHQSVAFMIADMATKYEASRLLLYETAWLFDQAYPTADSLLTTDASHTHAAAREDRSQGGGATAIAIKPTSLGRPKRKLSHNGEAIDLTARAASIKLLASTYAREVANLAVQVHGGAGYMEEYRVCRLYRDVKLSEIGGGTSEIQKQIIARSEQKRVR